MRTAELIRLKRDGETLPTDEIFRLIDAYTRDEIPEYQIAALLMAIYFRGLDTRETSDWTQAMIQSGETLEFPDLPRNLLVDKHSTGGVGDKVSLVLAPLVAELGLFVPMISGRGLGHTGGTLDKLESIPGYNASLTQEELQHIVKTCGFAITGQTTSLVPADRKFYALRDVTATVASIPMIVASIMSKKLAEGIGGLVLDVKVGSGAFMRSLHDARTLARAMVRTGCAMGTQTRALITDMDQPLGNAIGNAIEVAEAISCLQGQGPGDLREISCRLAVEMLQSAHPSLQDHEALERVETTLSSGAAFERFARAMRAQNGDVACLHDLTKLPTAPHTLDIFPNTKGFVSSFQCTALGQLAMRLGAGRAKSGDPIDHAVGITLLAKHADPVDPSTPIARVHCRNLEDGQALRAHLLDVIGISPEKPSTQPLIIEQVTESVA